MTFRECGKPDHASRAIVARLAVVLVVAGAMVTGCRFHEPSVPEITATLYTPEKTTESPRPKSISVLQVCAEMQKFLNDTWPGTRGSNPQPDGSVWPEEFRADLKLMHCGWSLSWPSSLGPQREPAVGGDKSAWYAISDEKPGYGNGFDMLVQGTKVRVEYTTADWQTTFGLILEADLDPWYATLALPTRAEWIKDARTTREEIVRAAETLISVTNRATKAIS